MHTPHTADLCLKSIQKNGWKRLSPSSYSPELQPLVYGLFGLIKDHIQGQNYTTNEAVQEAMCHGLWTAEMEFYGKEILRLLEWWQNASIMIEILQRREYTAQIFLLPLNFNAMGVVKFPFNETQMENAFNHYNKKEAYLFLR